jgi:predicted nuclease of predicted toxin-antitoxin system
VTPPRFLTDEDMPASVARALIAAGFDAVTTPACRRLGESDESQLRFAAKEGRTIVTYNVGDFARLHAGFLTVGQRHSGIVVNRQRNVGDTVKRLLRLANAMEAEALVDRLEFLSDWRRDAPNPS